SAIAPIRRRPKKRNAEPRQNSKYRQSVLDPLVNPGSPPHRHQARPKADPTRTHHCMVTLAQSSPGRRSTCPLQNTTTVMLGRWSFRISSAWLLPALPIERPAQKKDRAVFAGGPSQGGSAREGQRQGD